MYLEDVVPRLHVGDVDPLAVDVRVVRVVAAWAQALGTEEAAGGCSEPPPRPATILPCPGQLLRVAMDRNTREGRGTGQRGRKQRREMFGRGGERNWQQAGSGGAGRTERPWFRLDLAPPTHTGVYTPKS